MSVTDFHLRVNCGNNDYDVTGWERDDGYVSGGADYVFSTVNTGSDPAEAPADVYKSCRHQTPHSYTFADVPNGTYTLRLHLLINSTDRSFTYTAEGVTLEQNWNPAPTNDLVNVAQVHDFTVAVTDGNGLTLECSSTFVDVFECGIEVIAQPKEPIVVTYPNGGENLLVGQTITLAWQGDCSQLSGVELKISPDEGENWVSIDASGSVNCGTESWEHYEWTIPETLGGISLVSNQCLVKISEYNGSAQDQSDAVFSIGSGATVLRAPGHLHAANGPRIVRNEGTYTVSATHTGEAAIFDIRGVLISRVRGGEAAVSTARGMHLLRLRDQAGGESLVPVIAAE